MGTWRGTWKEGFFTGDPEGYLTEGSGNCHLSLGDPLEAGGRGLFYWEL